MRSTVRAVALASALAALSPCLAAAFTLEQVLGAPFASHLTAAPAGGRVAWVVEVRGVRNVWGATAAGGEARALTQYTVDDGQELGGLAWSADGRTVVYARGGGPNGEGEIPNPTSDPEGAKQEVWAVPFDGGAPRRLGEGGGASVAPKRDLVAWVKGGQIWSARLDGKAPAAQLVHARGDARNLRWSPDGGRLAFVSRRENHSFVGVYDVAAKSLRYLDPSVDQDAAPVWSPDGRAVAFLRLPADPKAQQFLPQRAGFPWSIRVADPASGHGREVFRAREGRGSVFRNLDADDQLFWGDGDRLVFPWELDGWTHLYSVPTSGGEPVLLTPGDFEVENAELGPAEADPSGSSGRSGHAVRRTVVFSSNQGDIDRRHVWQVGVAGGPPAAVTAGAGLEWAPVGTSDGRIVCLRGDFRRPGLPAVVAPGAAPRDLAPGLVPADFPAGDLAAPQPVVFAAADGMPIHAQLFLPPAGQPESRRPAVVFFHGGSQRQMVLGWHYFKYYYHAYAFNQYLASRGFVVLSVNYRSGIGYGMEFREALGYGAAGASEFNDVLGAGLYLRGRPDVRGDRIGLWGGSYGGYLTALGLGRASDLFAAGVDLHGVHDWNTTVPDFAKGYAPEARAEVARLAFASSPLASVKTWRSPVLLIQGDDDRNVPFGQTIDLVVALREQKVPVEQLVFPDEIHDFLLHASWLDAYRAAAEFFTRRLGS